MADFNPADHPRDHQGRFADIPDFNVKELVDRLIEDNGLWYDRPEDVGRVGLAHDPDEMPDLRKERARLLRDLAEAEQDPDGEDPDQLRQDLADVDQEIAILQEIKSRTGSKRSMDMSLLLDRAGPDEGKKRARQPMLYTRTYALEGIEIVRGGKGGDGRTVEAYAAVFDAPTEVRDQHGHYNEVIARTAFDKTLRERGVGNVSVIYNHGMTLHGTPSDMWAVPIGRAVEIKPDGRGLRTVSRYNMSPEADRILESIRNGDIRAQSFRGRIYQSNPSRVPPRRRGDGLPTITRTELGLTEYGPTPQPVYESAEIMSVRSVVGAIVGLDDDERAELIRVLSSTTPMGPETLATLASRAGTEEPHYVHSIRQSDIARRIRAGRTQRGMSK